MELNQGIEPSKAKAKPDPVGPAVKSGHAPKPKDKTAGKKSKESKPAAGQKRKREVAAADDSSESSDDDEAVLYVDIELPATDPSNGGRPRDKLYAKLVQPCYKQADPKKQTVFRCVAATPGKCRKSHRKVQGLRILRHAVDCNHHRQFLLKRHLGRTMTNQVPNSPS